MYLIVPYTAKSLGIAVLSEEAKVFFTTHRKGTVEVLHVDEGDNTTIYAGGQQLTGLGIDSKQR